MQRRPTMQRIADQLGVSKNSVYLALNAKPGVSEVLREKVLETARSMGYYAYGEPETVKRSKCLLTVIPEYLQNDAFFYADVLWSLEAEAKKHGLLVIKHTVTREAERALIPPALPDGINVVGFLAIGVFSEAYVTRLYRTKIPIVSVDIPYYESPVCCVGAANHAGGYTAARHLIEKGHTDIGFAGPVYAARTVYERWSGFRQALEETGISTDAAYNLIGQPGRFELFDTQEALGPSFERLKTYPTAWFCAGDRIALAMMNLLTLHGLRVPEDVSILGFDDLAVAQMILPRLTTLHVRRKHMGRLAVEHLLRCAESHQTLAHIYLPCTLIERDSVKLIG